MTQRISGFSCDVFFQHQSNPLDAEGQDGLVCRASYIATFHDCNDVPTVHCETETVTLIRIVGTKQSWYKFRVTPDTGQI